MKKRITTIDRFIKESKIFEAIQDISDWDLTSPKYASWVKKLKVGDKFKIDANGIDLYIIDRKEWERKKDDVIDATTSYNGSGSAAAQECEVIQVNAKVNIEDFDDNPTSCFIYAYVGGPDIDVFAMPNEW